MDSPADDGSAAEVEAPTGPVFPQHLLKAKPPYRPGVKRVPVDRFFKQEYHDIEVERIWKKAWQWVCREEELSEVGDHIVYEVADLSFIVIRTGTEEIKAYWNSCLHRARKICTFDGKRASELRCMFHGWAWNIDGSMKEMTCGWDFPGTKREEVSRLPEARTGVWGGFVFINPDPDCESLKEFLGELPEHFEGSGHDLAKRWKQVHVVTEVEANWKVVQEAFLEAWHTGHTHPQMVMPPGDPTAAPYAQRWDDFGNFMRWAVSEAGPDNKATPPFVPSGETQQQYIDGNYDFHLNETPPIIASDEESGVAAVHKAVREVHRGILGDAVDRHSDYYMSAGEMLMIWPNFHPWQGFTRLMYRFRPYRSDPNRSLMDVLLLTPWPEDRPRPAPVKAHVLKPGQPITDAVELGMLSRIFAQDLANIPYVQEGLKSSKSGYVILSDHNEAPLRHWHDRYDQWMGLEENSQEKGGEW